jgi:DNA topoisomerase-1
LVAPAVLEPVGKCPLCGKDVVPRKSKRGKIFYSCTGYPDCKFMSWDIPTEKRCSKCGGVICKKVLKDKTIYKCENTCQTDIADEIHEKGEENGTT